VERSKLLRTIGTSTLKFKEMRPLKRIDRAQYSTIFQDDDCSDLVNDVSSNACNRRTSSSKLQSPALMRPESHTLRPILKRRKTAFELGASPAQAFLRAMMEANSNWFARRESFCRNRAERSRPIQHLSANPLSPTCRSSQHRLSYFATKLTRWRQWKELTFVHR